MKEKNFCKVENERDVCKSQFSNLKSNFEDMINLLNMKITDNNGLDLCHNSEIYITKRRKDLLKKSLMSITDLKEPEKEMVKWMVFKSDTRKDIDYISKLMNGSITVDNLSKVIKHIKIIYKRVCAFSGNMTFEGCTDENVKNKIETFLKYILDVLKLEEQQLIDKKSIHDSAMDTDSKGSYQFDGKLRKQIDAIFDVNSTWKPKPTDIKQGQLADCSLLSALLSIIKTDPNAIKKCFFGQTKNTVKFRLFKVKIDTEYTKNLPEPGYKAIPNGKVIIEVQKSIFKDFKNKMVGNSSNDGLWVNMFEKAFTIYKSTNEYVTSTNVSCQTNIINKWQNTKPGSISIGNLEWGYGFIFLTAITGKCAVFRSIPTVEGKKFSDLKPKENSSNSDKRNYEKSVEESHNFFDKTLNGNVSENIPTVKGKKFSGLKSKANFFDLDKRNYEKSAEDLYNFFDKALKSNKAIVVSSRDDKFESWFKKFSDKTRDYSSPKNYPGLIKMHAYAMVGSVMEDSKHYKYIILQNPYMEDLTEYRVDESFKIKKVKSSDKSGMPKYQNLSHGQLKIELDDFIKYFASYDVCSKTKDEF